VHFKLRVELLKNILYISGSVVIFFFGMVLYGIILNFREKSLREEMQEKNIVSFSKPNIIVNKKSYRLELYDDTVMVKVYKVSIGKGNRALKESFNDNTTPSGEYFICAVDTLSKYRKFLLINYPNQWDIVEAYKKQWLTKDEYLGIVENMKHGKYSLENYDKFARVGIHGIGTYDFIFRNLPFTFNWTNGSIAVSNNDIDELYSVVKIGTPVRIRE